MNRIRKYIAFFAIGGAGYGTIEILWRGHTHWTMIMAGGICFVIFSQISERLAGKPLILKAVLCSGAVTVVEFVFGVIFNLLLKMDIWDYSKLPLNLLGQICPLFSLMWGVLGLLFLPLSSVMNKKLAV